MSRKLLNSAIGQVKSKVGLLALSLANVSSGSRGVSESSRGSPALGRFRGVLGVSWRSLNGGGLVDDANAKRGVVNFSSLYPAVAVRRRLHIQIVFIVALHMFQVHERRLRDSGHFSR